MSPGFANRRITTGSDDVKKAERFEFDRSLGIVPVGGGKFLVARGTFTKNKGHTGKMVLAEPDKKGGLRLANADSSTNWPRWRGANADNVADHDSFVRSSAPAIFTFTEMPKTLNHQLDEQRLANGYELVDGVAVHAENGERFQVPHPVLKKHFGIGHFVDLRIDSPRFSVHDDAAEKCRCESCNGDATKPILRHEEPATLLPLPRQNVPSRGWGEDFWVQVMVRDGRFFKGVVDNPLYEARLHGLRQGDEIVFHEDHILAVHGIHRPELVLGMDEADLKELAQWLGSR